MSIPIYCLNLKRADKRKEQIIENWINKLGFDINFFEAFDKKEIEEKNHYIYQYQHKIPILKIKRPMSTGEIACATSFCLLSEKILSLGLDEVIFMEDDVLPLIESKNQLFDMIKNGKEEYPNMEMALLFKPCEVSPWYHQFEHQKFYERKQYFSLLKTAPWGTYLVYFNRNGLQKFYDNLVLMQYPTDFVWEDVFAKEKTIIYCNIPMAYHENITTYIGNEYRGIKRDYIND